MKTRLLRALVCTISLLVVFTSISFSRGDRSNATHRIRLGFLGATNLPNSNTQCCTGPALFAVRLALEQFNAQTELLPNTKIELINNNTNSDAGTTCVQAFDQILQRGVVGLIGELNSGNSISASYASTYYKVPMISYGSTSPDFTTFHSKLYPYFLRTIPSQISETVLLAHLIASQEWSRVGLVYATDSGGVTGAQAFFTTAAQLNIQVTTAAFSPGATVNEIYFSMQQLKTAGITILLAICNPADMITVMKAQIYGSTDGQPALKMYGPGYQWIGYHSWMASTLFTNSTGGIIPDYYDFAQGVIGAQNYADVNSTTYQSYAKAWTSHAPASDLPSLVPSDPTSIAPVANYAYDAFWLYVRALHRMETEFQVDMTNTPTDAQRLLFLNVLKNVTLTGVSGPVSLDANGDRSAPFDLQNIQGKSLVSVGKITETGDIVLYDNIKIQYMGGSKALDHIVRGIYVIPSDVRTGMTVMTVLCMVAVFVGLMIIVALKGRPVFKAASPPFLLSMLVGVELLLASLFARIQENSDTSVNLCNVDLFLANLGYTLIVGSLLVKTYRLDFIFGMKNFRQTLLRDWMLFAGLAVLCTLQCAVLLGLAYGDPYHLVSSSYDSTSDYLSCKSAHPNTNMAIIMTFRFFLLLVTAIYCYRIRNIPDGFNESKQLGLIVYNLTFLSILLPIIDTAMDRGKGNAVIAYGISVFIISLGSAVIMLLPKIYVNAVYGANRANNETEIAKNDVSSVHQGSGGSGGSAGMKNASTIGAPRVSTLGTQSVKGPGPTPRRTSSVDENINSKLPAFRTASRKATLSTVTPQQGDNTLRADHPDHRTSISAHAAPPTPTREQHEDSTGEVQQPVTPQIEPRAAAPIEIDDIAVLPQQQESN